MLIASARIINLHQEQRAQEGAHMTSKLQYFKKIPWAVRYASIEDAESDSKQKKVEAGEELKCIEVQGPSNILSGCKPVVADPKTALNPKQAQKSYLYKGAGKMVGLVDAADESLRVGMLVRGHLITDGVFHTLGLEFDDAFPVYHPFAIQYASIEDAESDSKQKKVVKGQARTKKVVEGLGKSSEFKPVASPHTALNAKNGQKYHKYKGAGKMVGLVDTADESLRVGMLVRGSLITDGVFHTLGLEFDDAFLDRFVLPSSSKTILLRWMDANMRESGSIPRLSMGQWYELAREAGAGGDAVAVATARNFVMANKRLKTSTAKDASGRKTLSWKDGKRPGHLDSEPGGGVQSRMEIQLSSSQLRAVQGRKRSHAVAEDDSAYMQCDEEITVYTPSVATKSVTSAVTTRSRSLSRAVASAKKAGMYAEV